MPNQLALAAAVQLAGFAGHHSHRNNPNFEVFWADNLGQVEDGKWRALERGWYWWSCSPGCLPDGDPSGPFNSSAEAYRDATQS